MATVLEEVLKRDRLVVLASLIAVGLIAWLYLFHLAADMAAMEQPSGDMSDMPGMEGMSDMPGMDMPEMDMPGMDMATEEEAGPASPAIATAIFLAAMWMVMMVGMMLPSAAATILLFAALERKRQTPAGPYGRTALFVSGYFLVWAAFSIVAATVQAALSDAGLISTEMAVTSGIVGGVIFILAGLYEFTPLKDRCLAHCRTPLEWIARHQRPGALGALRMGAAHGIFCVGCCWMLMLLLFVGSVMNLLWVAVLAGIVLVQKLFPRGPLVARLAGGAFVIVGIALIARPLLTA